MTRVFALSLFIASFLGFIGFVSFCDWVLKRREITS